MHTCLPIFLVLSLLALAFTAPSSILKAPATCFSHPARNPPNLDDCVRLLDIASHFPSVHRKVTYGRNRPPSGTVPSHETVGSCRFVLNVTRPTSIETETFILVQYFPAIYKIIDECFGPESLGYTMGTVNVGEEGKFLVHMGAYIDRTIQAPRWNGTALLTGNSDIGAAKGTAVS